MGASLALSARLGGGRRRRAGLDAAAGAGWVMVGASGLDERSGGAEAPRVPVHRDRGAEFRRALARLGRGAEAPRVPVHRGRGAEAPRVPVHRDRGAEARRALLRLDRGAEARRALARLDRGAEAPRALVRLDRGVLRAQFAPMEANEARCLASLVATLTNRLTAHADRAR